VSVGVQLHAFLISARS